MPSPIRLEITADDRDLYNKLVRSEKKYADLKRQMIEGGRSGSKAFEDVGKSTDNTSLSVSKLADSTKKWISTTAGIGTALGAVMALKKVYDELISAQKESRKLAKDVALTLDQARTAATHNLPEDFGGGVAGLDAMAKRVSKNSGMPMLDVYKALSGLLSAKGAVSDLNFEKTAEIAAFLHQRSGGNIDAETTGVGLLKMLKVPGIDSPEIGLGYVKQLGAAALIKTAAGQLRMLDGIVAGDQVKDSPKQAAAMMATISHIIGDSTGERTVTMYRSGALRLSDSELVPYQKTNNRTGKKETLWRRAQGNNSEERIDDLRTAYERSSDDQRAEIRSRIGTEAIQFIGPAITRSPLWENQYKSSKAAIKAPSAEAIKIYQQYKKDIMNSPWANIANASYQSSVINESVSSANIPGALAVESDQAWDELIKRNGNSALLDVPYWGYMLRAGIADFNGGDVSKIRADYIRSHRESFSGISPKDRDNSSLLFDMLSKSYQESMSTNTTRNTPAKQVSRFIRDTQPVWGVLEYASPGSSPMAHLGPEHILEFGRVIDAVAKKVEKFGDRIDRSAKIVDDTLPPNPNSQNFD